MKSFQGRLGEMFDALGSFGQVEPLDQPGVLETRKRSRLDVENVGLDRARKGLRVEFVDRTDAHGLDFGVVGAAPFLDPLVVVIGLPGQQQDLLGRVGGTDDVRRKQRAGDRGAASLQNGAAADNGFIQKFFHAQSFPMFLTAVQQ